MAKGRIYMATFQVHVPIAVDGPTTIGTATDEPEELDEQGHAEWVARNMIGWFYGAYDKASEGGAACGDGRIFGCDVLLDAVVEMVSVASPNKRKDSND
jgi:hypothetical protein